MERLGWTELETYSRLGYLGGDLPWPYTTLHDIQETWEKNKKEKARIEKEKSNVKNTNAETGFSRNRFKCANRLDRKRSKPVIESIHHGAETKQKLSRN